MLTESTEIMTNINLKTCKIWFQTFTVNECTEISFVFNLTMTWPMWKGSSACKIWFQQIFDTATLVINCSKSFFSTTHTFNHSCECQNERVKSYNKRKVITECHQYFCQWVPPVHQCKRQPSGTSMPSIVLQQHICHLGQVEMQALAQRL